MNTKITNDNVLTLVGNNILMLLIFSEIIEISDESEEEEEELNEKSSSDNETDSSVDEDDITELEEEAVVDWYPTPCTTAYPYKLRSRNFSGVIVSDILLHAHYYDMVGVQNLKKKLNFR